MNIIIRYQDIPCRVKAFSATNHDGTYTIVINSRHSYLEQRKAFAHEVQHIHGGDLDNIDPALQFTGSHDPYEIGGSGMTIHVATIHGLVHAGSMRWTNHILTRILHSELPPQT